MTQLPSATGMMFDNFTQDSLTRKRYSYANLVTPLGRWGINFTSIKDSELATLEAFFNAQLGRLKPFTFLDPHGNLVTASENFSDGSWALTAVTVAATGQPDPFGGSLASRMASSGSEDMETVVLPGGSASGVTLCASVYVKMQSGSGSLTIGFKDAGAGIVASKAWPVDTNWRRIFCPVTLATAGVIRVFLTGLAGSASAFMFGFQVAPLPGPGAYTKTPGNYGLHSKCYFATDVFGVTLKQYNSNAVSLPIEETM